VDTAFPTVDNAKNAVLERVVARGRVTKSEKKVRK
jgi:hypothetical protein